MAEKKKADIVSEKFVITVRREQTISEETESTGFGKEKPEKIKRERSTDEEIISVTVDELDIKKFVKLVYGLDK